MEKLQTYLFAASVGGLILLTGCIKTEDPTAPEGAKNYEGIHSLQKSGKCVTPPPNLVNWWPGDGNADDIQDGNPGTPVGGTTFAQGLVGQAFSFDGNVGTGVFIGDQANLENLSQITIDAWVNTTGGGDQPIITKHSSTNPSWVLRTFFGDNTGRVSFGVETNLGTTVTFNELVSTTSITDGQFHHVAGTYDGSTVKLYVDGVLEASAPLSGTIKNSIYRVVIGNFDFLGLGILLNNAFNGLIDEVEVYDRALTASEIQAIFDAGGAGKCKKVTICHKPGTPAQKTLVIPIQALAGHLGHGDTIGPCN